MNLLSPVLEFFASFFAKIWGGITAFIGGMVYRDNQIHKDAHEADKKANAVRHRVRTDADYRMRVRDRFMRK